MKKTVLLLAAIAAVAFTGCSSDEEIVHSNYPADNVVRVTVGVDNMKTRASYTTDNLTDFGLTIYNPTSDTYSYDNINVTRISYDSWEPERLMLWQNATTPVTILAIAPYPNFARYDVSPVNITNFRFSARYEQEARDPRYDLLVCKKKDFVPQTDLTAMAPLLLTLSTWQANSTFRLN